MASTLADSSPTPLNPETKFLTYQILLETSLKCGELESLLKYNQFKIRHKNKEFIELQKKYSTLQRVNSDLQKDNAAFTSSSSSSQIQTPNKNVRIYFKDI